MNNDFEGEVWKSVVDYEGLYEISNYGRLVSYYKKNGRGVLESPRFLKGKIDKDGYLEYALSKNREMKHKRSHRLVAETFIPNPFNKPEVNHIDGIKLNNHVSNLEWVNASENGIHKYKNGLGEKARDIASITHGRACKLIDVNSNSEYKFNSLAKASEFLGKRNGWLKYKLRKGNYENDILELGYIMEVEDKRTYERIAEKS